MLYTYEQLAPIFHTLNANFNVTGNTCDVFRDKSGSACPNCDFYNPKKNACNGNTELWRDSINAIRPNYPELFI